MGWGERSVRVWCDSAVALDVVGVTLCYMHMRMHIHAHVMHMHMT